MYNSEKLWYLKLPKDFFRGHRVQILRAAEEGDSILLFYLILVCESIPYLGNLRYGNRPYSLKELGLISKFPSEEFVRRALSALIRAEMIEIHQDGSLFIPEVKKLTIATTAGAEAMAKYRSAKEENYKCKTNKDKDKDIDKDIDSLSAPAPVSDEELEEILKSLSNPKPFKKEEEK